jgi:hypothetical protein
MFCELNDLNMFRARQLKHVKRKLPELEASLERPYTRGQAEIMAQAQDLRKFVHIDRHHRNGSVRTVPSATESELEVRWKRFAVEGTCK